MKFGLFNLLIVVVLGGCGGGGGSPQLSQDTSCSITRKIVTYPNDYLGSYVIPTPASKLPNQIERSIDLKDYWPGISKLPAGCTDKILYSRNLYKETLDRIKELGADIVWVTNYGPWADLNQIPWQLSSNIQIPDEELKFLISEIKKRGMKVRFLWQMYNVDVKGNSYPSNFTESQLDNWMLSHRNLMINLSKLSQQLEIDVLAVDWQAFFISNLSNDPNLKEKYISYLSSTIDEIKKHYSGKLLYGASGHNIGDSRILSKVDYVRNSLQVYLTEQEHSILSVNSIKNKYIEHLRQFAELTNSFQSYPNLKLEILSSVQSRDKYFIDGWVEDGFCVSSCIQSSYKTDFSVQAMGIEATFQAIIEQKLLPITAVTVGPFWHTDDIKPTSVDTTLEFPNLSGSIRNKPAENIVKHWFSKN